MSAQPFVLQWRLAVVGDNGPPSGVRHVLLTLSLYMDGEGGSCFPSIRELERATALAEKTVRTHLAAAEQAGWITRKFRGRSAGQAWRSYEYVARIPEEGAVNITGASATKGAVEFTGASDEGAVAITGASKKGAVNNAEGAVNKGRKVRQPLPTISSVNSPKNSTTTTVHSPAASDTVGSAGDVSPKQKDTALSKDANAVVLRLSELRDQHGAVPVAAKRWGEAVRMAKAMLDEDIPQRELLATLDWAFQDDYWRAQFIASGMKALRIGHANWLQRDKKKPARGKYQDTATEPKLSGVMLEVQS